jgi:ankyrin repeat protein
MARLLVETYGADAALEDGDGYRAEHHAANAGHRGLAEYLSRMTRRTDLLRADFFSAIGAGETETVKSILTAHPYAVRWRDEEGLTGLMRCAQMGDGALATTQALLDARAPPDAENANGSVALMYAARGGHEATVKLLLARGANVNRRNARGVSALMAACAEGHEDLARALLDSHRADPTLEDANLMTAAHYALKHGHDDLAAYIHDLNKKAARLVPREEMASDYAAKMSEFENLLKKGNLLD